MNDAICEKDPTKQVVFDVYKTYIYSPESFESKFFQLVQEFLARNKAKNFDVLRTFDDMLNFRFCIYAYGEESFASEECSILYVPYKMLYSRGLQVIKPSWDVLQAAQTVFSDALIKVLLESFSDGKPSGDEVLSVPPSDGCADKRNDPQVERASNS